MQFLKSFLAWILFVLLLLVAAAAITLTVVEHIVDLIGRFIGRRINDLDPTAVDRFNGFLQGIRERLDRAFP